MQCIFSCCGALTPSSADVPLAAFSSRAGLFHPGNKIWSFVIHKPLMKAWRDAKQWNTISLFHPAESILFYSRSRSKSFILFHCNLCVAWLHCDLLSEIKKNYSKEKWNLILQKRILFLSFIREICQPCLMLIHPWYPKILANNAKVKSICRRYTNSSSLQEEGEEQEAENINSHGVNCRQWQTKLLWCQ